MFKIADLNLDPLNISINLDKQIWITDFKYNDVINRGQTNSDRVIDKTNILIDRIMKGRE
jgi:hypothetical protein